MITMLIANEKKQELKALEEYSHFLAGKLTEEEWKFFCLMTDKKLWETLKEEMPLDVACLDVEMKKGLEAAEEIRRKNNHAYLLLVASPAISPAVYMKPTILAGSLLLRPLGQEQIKRVLEEAFAVFCRQFDKAISGEGEQFVIENREGKTVVDYSQIYYFEAREKKVFLVTGSSEMPFYDTIENVSEKLPDTFVRCHRGFLVNGSKIRKISLTENLVYLEGGYEIPISRNNRKRMKEWKT